MGLRCAFLLFCSLFASLSLFAQQPSTPPAWKTDLTNRRATLVRENGSGTDPVLRDRLLTMYHQDQEVRGFHLGAGVAPPLGTLSETDHALTEQLKGIVAEKGWPTIALVGLDASNAGMTLLIHSSDHAWQRQLLPELEQLADTGKIDGSALALVIDKELVASGKLQRYGSQFKYVNGSMAMFAVEDPAGLDRRRAQVMLPPMVAYEDTLTAMYHLKVSKQIVMPATQ